MAHAPMSAPGESTPTGDSERFGADALGAPDPDSGFAPLAELWVEHAGASLGVRPARIERFVAMAQAQGLGVDIARFALDPRHAFRVLSQTHASADIELRVLSLHLFDALQKVEQRRSGWIHLH